MLTSSCFSKQPTALICGTGSIGSRHIANISRILPNCLFVIVRRDSNIKPLPTTDNCILVGSLEDTLELEPDFAIISTPSSKHVEALEFCILHDIPFYVEKPIVTSLAQYKHIANLLLDYKHKQTSTYGCNLRFLPSLQKLKSLISLGTLGNIARATFEAGQWLPDWRPGTDYQSSYSADIRLGGGVIFDLVHEIDSAQYLLGPQHLLSAAQTNFKPLNIASPGCASLITTTLDNTILSSINLDYVSRSPHRSYTVVGDKCSAHWSLAAASLTLCFKNRIEIVSSGKSDFDVKHTYHSAMIDFLTAVSTGSASVLSIEDGLKISRLAIEASSSS